MIKRYFDLVQISHTIFALPFAFLGFFWGLKDTAILFSVEKILLVLCCMFFARNAAMAFNRYVDRQIDLKNPRTSQVRPIPLGIISPQNALLFIFFNVLCFVSATYFLNKLCFFLSPIALLVILGYSYTKRFTKYCHLVLGLGLALAPIGAYLAVAETLYSFSVLLLGFAVLFWVAGFDIIYALQDELFDKKEKLFSLPSILGIPKALYLARIFHMLSFCILLALYFYASFLTWIYLLACFFFGFFLLYQHYLIRNMQWQNINRAFFITNGWASIVFSVLVIFDLLK